MAEGRILLVEDDTVQRRMLTDILSAEGYDIVSAGTVDSALAAFAAEPALDLVLSDWKLGGSGDGLVLMRKVRERAPEVGFVLITAYGTITHAVAAVRDGVDDYLPKPFERVALLLAVERTLRTRRLLDANKRLEAELGDRDRLLDLLGRSPAMQVVYRQLQRVAPTDTTVLLSGESGTRKELAARALHRLSARSRGPFVAVNCAAMPGALFEAELFGCKKGAFTGASSDRIGRLESASGGTLFLDEVGDLPLELQPKLLRVLEQHKVTPLGCTEEVELDLRFVAATHRDLRKMVEEGRFREDLYWRLAVLTLELPPLRERREDLPLLIEHLVARSARAQRIAPPALPPHLRKRLMDHPWPGNVRELANTIERLVTLSESGLLKLEDLPPGFGASEANGSSTAFALPPRGVQWDELESSFLRQALVLANGNKKAAAALLGMPYKAFLYRIEKFGLTAVDTAAELEE